MLTQLKISWKSVRSSVGAPLVSALLLLFLLSCSPADEVDYGFGEYYVEIVTALENNAFLLDQGRTIYDSNKTARQSFAAGDRIYLYFSYGKTLSDPITVHGAAKVFSDVLKTMAKEAIAQETNDPIQFVSAWIGSYYLNMDFYFEYRSVAHKIDLVIDEKWMDDSEIHIYFRHNKNGDAPGYPISVYASFDLSKVLGEPQGDRTLFVHFDTGNYGNKTCTFKY